MTKNVKHVYPGTDRKEIGEIFSKYDFIALPVVNEEKQLLGIITIDDVFDLLVPNPTRKKRRSFQ